MYRIGVEKSLHQKSPLFVYSIGHSYIFFYLLSFHIHLFTFFLGGIATMHVTLCKIQLRQRMEIDRDQVFG